MKKEKSVFFIILLVVICLVYLTVFGVSIGKLDIKGANQMRFGIDIKGGVEAIYRPKDYTPTASELESARQILETRLDAKNISDREITVDQENKYILLRFPWKSDEADFDPQTAISELGATAHLTFKDPDGNIVLEGKNVKSATARLDNQSQLGSSSSPYVVGLEFDAEGAKLFADATGRLINQQISIYMDDILLSAPVVQSQITDGSAIITGMKDLDDAKDLADKINSGALPFSMESSSNSTISPTLGQGALDVMVRAGLVTFILICLFMLIYYRLPGFVACIALTLQLVGQLLALSIPQFTLTLPGIAAVILSIGMGVDANIIVAERIKEELNAGKSVKAAIKAGFHRAFSSVFDGNITVMIVAIVLMTLGSGSILSFGYSLLTGVILNFVAGVTATRLMIQSLSCNEALQKPALYGARSPKKEKKEFKPIRFFSKRYVYYAISAAIIIVGIVSIFINGIELDIDFKGGSVLKYEYTGEVNTEEADTAITQALDRLTSCQTTTNTVTDQKFLVVNMAGNEGLSSEQQELLTDTLQENFKDANLSLYETSIVEPFIGQKFLHNGIWAIVISFVLIILYVWYSFRKIGGLSAGVMALIALIHDCFVVFFVFVIFRIPINENFIAAVLTIIGFSVNDTIVIYDRIRENTLAQGGSKTPIDELVDKSITQSLSRSVNTNAAVFVSIVMVCIFALIFGISSILSFALPMTFGVVSGCYSTVCLAGPLWVSWKKFKAKKTAR